MTTLKSLKFKNFATEDYVRMELIWKSHQFLQVLHIENVSNSEPFLKLLDKIKQLRELKMKQTQNADPGKYFPSLPKLETLIYLHAFRLAGYLPEVMMACPKLQRFIITGVRELKTLPNFVSYLEEK